MSIYVEIDIRGSLDELWHKTQAPEQHGRWDLRFTEIEYLPRPDEAQPQRFLYATRLGFGLEIRGEGETVGNREGRRGERTSALRFWSDDGKSLIREGSGYWQYVPSRGGVRFLTRYDYRTRFGAPGRTFDRLVFRPLIGWATAWSFDRLRLWIEQGIDPAVSLRRSLVHAAARVGLAALWLNRGLAATPGRPGVLGPLEVLFGLTLLVAWRSRALFVGSVVLLALDAPAVARQPVTPGLGVLALSVLGSVSGSQLPSAGRCRRTPEAAA